MTPEQKPPLTNEEKLNFATNLHRTACKSIRNACDSIISPNVNYSLIDKLTDKIGCDAVKEGFDEHTFTSGDELIDYLEEQVKKAHLK